MEGGLHASLAKFVLDADLLAMVAALLDPIVVDEDTLAVDAIREVGPGGHFFGVGHTQERFRTAFHRPMVSDWRNYETWAEAGAPEAAGKAARLAEQFLARYEPPRHGPRRPRGARRLRRPARRRGRRAHGFLMPRSLETRSTRRLRRRESLARASPHVLSRSLRSGAEAVTT